jgi:hypothetical protein
LFLCRPVQVVIANAIEVLATCYSVYQRSGEFRAKVVGPEFISCLYL